MSDADELELALSAPAEGVVVYTREMIDAMDYEEMLCQVLFAPLGDPLFQGDVGLYFHAVMKQKRSNLSHDARVAISKKIGF